MFILKCSYDGFASFLFKNVEEAKKWRNLFQGQPEGDNYPVPVGIRNREGPEKRSEVLPDFTHMGLSPIPTFSERAVHALKDILDTHGELAPIQMDEAMRYWAFNTTVIVDKLLDKEKSDIAYFSSGRVMAVDHYVLRPDIPPLPWIFKIPETSRNTTYVNQAFVDRVKKEGLTGFKFLLLP